MLAVFYTLVTVAVALALVFLIWRAPAALGAEWLWSLSALLPLLTALSVAVLSQQRAAQALQTHPWGPTYLTVLNGVEVQGLDLDATGAACVERALRLSAGGSSEGIWTAADGTRVRLGAGTQVRGALPAPAVAQALAIRGELRCPALRLHSTAPTATVAQEKR